MRGMDRLARRVLLGVGAARRLPILAVALLSCAKPQADEPPTDKIVSEQSQAWSLVRGGDGPVSPTGTTRYSLHAITWGGERFVAVGSDGVILHSRGGDRWEIATDSATRSGLYGVAWNGDRFVAVGDEGTVVHSRDGDRWEPSSGALDAGAWHRWSDVLWNGDRFVAVGDDALIAYSSDGDRWEIAGDSARWKGDRIEVVGEYLDLHSVAWSGERFVAVGGEGGLIVHSDDGDYWEPASGAVDLGGW